MGVYSCEQNTCIFVNICPYAVSSNEELRFELSFKQQFLPFEKNYSIFHPKMSINEKKMLQKKYCITNPYKKKKKEHYPAKTTEHPTMKIKKKQSKNRSFTLYLFDIG